MTTAAAIVSVIHGKIASWNTTKRSFRNMDASKLSPEATSSTVSATSLQHDECEIGIVKKTIMIPFVYNNYFLYFFLIIIIIIFFR